MRTDEDKRKFIEALEEIPNISAVCKRVGIAKATIYRWLDGDEEFAGKVENALTKGRSSITDLAEGQLIGLIKKAEPWSIRFWLENNTKTYRRPKKAMSHEEARYEPVREIIIVQDPSQNTSDTAKKIVNLLSNREALEDPNAPNILPSGQ